MIVKLDKKYYLPDDWSTITLQKFIDINEFELKEDLTEDEKLEFYLNYCSNWIPKEILKKTKLIDEDGIGLLGLFNHLWQFTRMPEDAKQPAEQINLEGSIYKFVDANSNLSKPFQDLTFEEYEEANAVLTALNKMKENKLENLALLLAIFYRPVRKGKVVAYDSNETKIRAEVFKACLTMDDVWACYFFLFNRMRLSVLGTADSLLKEVEKNLV